MLVVNFTGCNCLALASNAAVDLTYFLSPPPVPGSDDEKRDLQSVVNLQTTSTAERRQRAIEDNAEDVRQLLKGVLSVELTMTNAPRALKTLQRSTNILGHASIVAKAFWGRPRPFLVDGRVHCWLGARPTNPAYPSGHTIFAYDNALIIGAMIPELREALLARAADYALSRVILGVHYPTDIEAGRLAGTVLAAVFLDHEPASAFATARAELRALLGYPPIAGP